MSVLSVAITVIDIEDENDPVFTSSDTASFDENGTGIVYTTVATDASTVTYSLTGMIDDDLFTVGSNSGDLTFIDTPDFENALDSDADNVYEITITATDASGNTAHLVIAITVNEEPLSVIRNKDISVYPNPSADRFWVTFDNHVKIEKIRVVNQSGISVIEFRPNKDHSYDISSLSEGLYYIILDQFGKTKVTYRIIKRK